MLEGLAMPAPDGDSAPFWNGCEEGKLMLQRCDGCGQASWPPGPVCASCGGDRLTWVESQGRGTVYSWVVVAVAFTPELADQLPYAVGLVDLEDGVRMVTTFEGCEPNEIEAGMEVEMRFDESREGQRLFCHVPAGSDRGSR
ncbi:MAG: Zn-ribbon domain-containing OB-fold protein [Actinobacteria bacterium]|nr:Zn-ribbon domain-containing OB-fold protein [Actinomycetota bacterium]